jgi:hypothetical protein
MAYQMTFQRYELKYMLTRQQKEHILQAMTPYMALDRYGRSTIRNIYFDTENFRLIRRSIERPVYKEKLRLRSYTQAKADTPVFVELKKKYRSVVYKRRLDLPEQQAMDCLCTGAPLPVQSQIASEIDYFLHYYQTLRPAVFLSYEREAYYPLDRGDFRVTFDHNILYRRNELSLCAGVWGNPLLQNDQVLMEIKTSGGIPLWMTQVLTREHIHKTSYSKYGSAYEQILQSQQKGELRYA